MDTDIYYPLTPTGEIVESQEIQLIYRKRLANVLNYHSPIANKLNADNWWSKPGLEKYNKSTLFDIFIFNVFIIDREKILDDEKFKELWKNLTKSQKRLEKIYLNDPELG